MFDFFRKRRRDRLRAQPFPEEWLAILHHRFPLFRALPAEDQEELKGHIQVFLAEKSFEGCGGLELTDEILVTIAAQACLLLLHRETDYYPRLYSILVYPQNYVSKDSHVNEHGVVLEGDSTRLGESWTSGSVVLSWDAVKSGGADPEDGNNVVFHEFAHQLDGEDDTVAGVPPLGRGLKFTERRSKYISWARVMKSEFEHLQFMERHNKKTFLDPYGATNAAEFFAVATEFFFEKPREMLEKHPELYAELKDYFGQDPATWDFAAAADER